MEYQVKEPIEHIDCPIDEDIENPQCQACTGMLLCERESHNIDECFKNCRLCETERQAHNDGSCEPECEYCLDEKRVEDEYKCEGDNEI